MNVLYIALVYYPMNEETGEYEEQEFTVKVPVTYDSVSIDEVSMVLEKVKEQSEDLESAIPVRIKNMFMLDLGGMK